MWDFVSNQKKTNTKICNGLITFSIAGKEKTYLVRRIWYQMIRFLSSESLEMYSYSKQMAVKFLSSNFKKKSWCSLTPRSRHVLSYLYNKHTKDSEGKKGRESHPTSRTIPRYTNIAVSTSIPNRVMLRCFTFPSTWAQRCFSWHFCWLLVGLHVNW